MRQTFHHFICSQSSNDIETHFLVTTDIDLEDIVELFSTKFPDGYIDHYGELEIPLPDPTYYMPAMFG